MINRASITPFLVLTLAHIVGPLEAHLCTFCNVKRFATASNLYRHMRRCPRNPNPQKGKATGSRSQGEGEIHPFVPNAAKPSDTYPSQSPHITPDPNYGGPGTQVGGEGASTSMQSLMPGSLRQDLGALSAQNTPVSGPDNHEMLGTDLPFSTVTWENFSSPLSQGHVGGSVFPFPYIDASSSDWYEMPAHPGIMPEGNQDISARALDGSRFHQQLATPTPMDAMTSPVQSPTADITATMVMFSGPLFEMCATNRYARKPIPRFAYPSTSDVTRDALQGDQLLANVVLDSPVRRPPQLSRTAVLRNALKEDQ